MIVREANSNDWEELLSFYSRVYRKGHPLQNKQFWEWQYGNIKEGVAYIALEEGSIIAHLGANFGGELAWTLNLFISPEYRGKGISEALHNEIRKYAPLAAISASEKGLRMYKRMGWIQHENLVRYVKVNPIIKELTTEKICVPIQVEIENLRIRNTHYFSQPTINGIKLNSSSTGVSQERVGGLRMVDINNVIELEKQAWKLGYLWMDYVTSWNDSKIKELEKNNWVIDSKNVVPWLLNPIVKESFANITYLSEKPIDNNFIVHRSFSDHGRVGSI